MERKPRRPTEEVPPPQTETSNGTGGGKEKVGPDVSIPEIFDSKFTKTSGELSKAWCRIFKNFSKLPFIKANDVEWTDKEFDELSSATIDICNKVVALRIILRVIAWLDAPFIFLEKVSKMFDGSLAIAERRARKEAAQQQNT